MDQLLEIAYHWPGPDGWNDDHAQHQAMSEWFAFWLFDRATEKGLVFGQDWGEFLASFDHVETVDIVMTEFGSVN